MIVFSLNGLKYYSIYSLSGISPIGAVEKLINMAQLDWNKYQLPSEITAPLAFLALICIIIAILIVVIIISCIKGLIKIANDPEESLYYFKNASLVNAIINLGSFAFVLIWNMFLEIGAGSASSEYSATIVKGVLGLGIPLNAIVFGILGIVGVVVINQFQSMLYKIDKQEKNVQIQESAYSEYVWYCSSCGAKNDNGNMFCVQCGKNK